MLAYQILGDECQTTVEEFEFRIFDSQVGHDGRSDIVTDLENDDLV